MMSKDQPHTENALALAPFLACYLYKAPARKNGLLGPLLQGLRNDRNQRITLAVVCSHSQVFPYQSRDHISQAALSVVHSSQSRRQGRLAMLPFIYISDVDLMYTTRVHNYTPACSRLRLKVHLLQDFKR